MSVRQRRLATLRSSALYEAAVLAVIAADMALIGWEDKDETRDADTYFWSLQVPVGTTQLAAPAPCSLSSSGRVLPDAPRPPAGPVSFLEIL